MDETAGQGAARDQGRLSQLAKLVDTSAILRMKLVELESLGVGTQSVESEAKRWLENENNSLGKVDEAEGKAKFAHREERLHL